MKEKKIVVASHPFSTHLVVILGLRYDIWVGKLFAWKRMEITKLLAIFRYLKWVLYLHSRYFDFINYF